jgi:hypothetical protein
MGSRLLTGIDSFSVAGRAGSLDPAYARGGALPPQVRPVILAMAN